MRIAHRTGTWLALALVASLPAQIPPDERQRHLASFDFIWTTIRDRHYDPNLGGLDWNAVRAEVRPRVEAAKDAGEVRRALRDMIGRLKLSHFQIIPRELLREMARPPQENRLAGTTGIQVRVLEGAVVKPRQWTYPGRVAVLVDGGTVRGGEVFAVGLQELGRARVFGTRTAGIVQGGMVEELPNGDGFMFAAGDYESAKGKRVEGVGMIPDVEVAHRQEALLEGRDLPLEAALKWIEGEGRKTK